MDRNHQLKAPDNNELKDIEQVPDRSELSALYFDAHSEWDGKELISDDERQRRRDKHNEAITTSIRPQFATIGLLITTPLILLALIASAGATHVTIEALDFLLPIIVLTIGFWILVSFLSLRRVYAIFYNHALRATPFILVLLSLLGIVAQGLYLLLHSWLPSSLILATLLFGLCLMAASVVLSLITLYIWVAPRLSIEAKIGCLASLAGLLLLGVLLVMFL